MKMRMLLLVSAAVLLICLAAANPAPQRLDENLKSIIDLAEKINKTFNLAFYVEDVGDLAHGTHQCEDKFFCKVHDILHKHEHFAKGKEEKEEKELVRNLEAFIKGKNTNCTELLMEVTTAADAKPITKLVGHLTKCIRNRNFLGNR